MIPELWDYLTTASSKQARQGGYLYHSIALAHRARRCKQHWLNHLQNCHELLNSNLPKIQSGSRVAVLGSGLTLETPPEILAQHFEKIDLVDVVHTKDVRDVVGRFGLISGQIHKFRFIEMDLNLNELVGDYDFVISANLLSQLPYVISKNSRKQGKSTDEISRISNELQARHLEQIKKLSKDYILFSDFELKVVDLVGEPQEKSSTVDPELKINWENTWTWNLAPAPELSKEYSVELVIGATKNL